MSSRFALPWWTVFVLAGLFAPLALVHERVFGNGAGLVAALSGVVVGLGLAFASTRWRWDVFTTATATAAAYLALGGVAALRETTIAGFVPTARTLQTLVLQAVMSWKDLLTLAPPASFYTGPAVLPWLSGLLCALAAGLFTLRAGRYLAGSVALGLFALIGVAWGPGVLPSNPLGVTGWILAVLGWWAWAAGRRRQRAGADIVVGRRAVGGLVDRPGSDTGRRTITARTWRQLIAGGLTLALAGGLTLPALALTRAFDSRTVLRDLVEPPLDVQDYPSPLSAFRHYTTDLEKTTLVSVSSLPEGARVRLAVMDTYDGIAFGMSSPIEGVEGRYARAGTRLREQPWPGDGQAADLQFTTNGLIGPWLPTVGITDTLTFGGDDATALQAGLHVNRWANVALTTGNLSRTVTYATHTVVPPVWADGQLAGVGTGQLGGTPDQNVPDAIATFARDLTADELTQLGRARAIERYLATKGFFSNQGTDNSLPGHRADRLARMLDAPQLVGDDEQYATLMALMLHSLGIPARVVMGLYPEGKPPAGQVDLRGYDMHAWVEVEFEGIGWATFDPTPPRDHEPQSNVSKPRSVPRPQVLQPPEPPEPPVELPPSVTERPGGDPPEEPLEVPWALLGFATGGLLVLGGPVAAILLAKRSRTRRRRNAAPAAAVAGAWDEVVDLATDAGAVITPVATRQESARELGALWHEPDPGRDPATPQWRVAGQPQPPVLALARRADAATFGGRDPEPAEVAAAWAAAKDLRAGLSSGAGVFTRARRRLSLRSLRRRARLARARRKVRS